MGPQRWSFFNDWFLDVNYFALVRDLDVTLYPVLSFSNMSIVSLERTLIIYVNSVKHDV